MDEFDKIREISEDLTNRREPTFTQFNQPTAQSRPDSHVSQYQGPVSPVASTGPTKEYMQTSPAVASFLKQSPENPTHFGTNFNDKLDFVQVDTIEEKPFSSMKLHLIGISVFAGILSIVLAGFFFFNGENDNIDEVVTITTAPTIIKESPAQAGGMNIPDQDKLVYNRIRSDNVTTKVESLFPEPEKPVMPQILSIEDNTPAEKFVDMNKVKAVNPLEQQPQKLITDKQEKITSVNNKKQEIQDKNEQSLVNETPESAKPAILPLNADNKVALMAVAQKENDVSDKEKSAILPLKKEQPVAQGKPEKPTIKEAQKSGNIWRAQLFSSNNKSAVENAWERIQTKHKSLLSNMSYEIESAEIKGKGTWYRLKVGQFATRDMAATLCGKLKAQKQDCVPAK